MPRPSAKLWNPELPSEPDPKRLPASLDRTGVARVVSHYFFPVSSRTIEAWPLPYRVIAGRAVYRTAEVLAFARRLLESAPLIRGGRQPQSRQRSGDA